MVLFDDQVKKKIVGTYNSIGKREKNGGCPYLNQGPLDDHS